MVSWYLLLNALADEFNTKLYVKKSFTFQNKHGE
jgi:hypothetical protein